jgi:hypothetical protein
MAAALLSLSLLLGAQLSDGQTASESSQAGRAFHEINHDVRLQLKQQATAKRPDEQAHAARQLVTLYGEICQHPKLATSDTLKSYRVKLRSRLLRIQQELQRDIARAEKRGDAPGGSLADAATRAVADQLALVGYSLGGPGKVFAQGGAGVPDYGPALVELIQRSIAPGFWDVNGGPGTIVYYAPLRALVVRATGEIQGDVGGALKGLRRAGN